MLEEKLKSEESGQSLSEENYEDNSKPEISVAEDLTQNKALETTEKKIEEQDLKTIHLTAKEINVVSEMIKGRLNILSAVKSKLIEKSGDNSQNYSSLDFYAQNNRNAPVRDLDSLQPFDS